MTQAAVPSYMGFVATAGQTVFSVPFRLFAASDLEVYLNGVLTTAYSVSGVGNATGSITMTNPVGVGGVVHVRRVTPKSQLLDYHANDIFGAEAHEAALDRLTAEIQDVSEELSRRPAQAVDTAAALRNLLFPAPVGGTVLGWNALGTGLTNYVPPGIVFPATPTTVANVKDFGATGLGVADDTAAIQAALTASLRVYIPAGTYLIKGANSNQFDGLKLRSGQEVFGDGRRSILKQDPTCWYTLSANQWDQGTASTLTNIQYLFIHDLQFLGMVDTAGFSESQYQLFLSAVSDVLIERCEFRNMRGDGITISSGGYFGVERHNERITIRDCFFIASNNMRQGISCVDCNRLTIEHNFFAYLTRPDMPGAIDIEPNQAFNINRDLTIRDNRFFNCGGFAGAISLILLPSYTLPVFNVVVENNTVENCIGNSGLYFHRFMEGTGTGIADTSAPVGLRVLNNTVSSHLTAGSRALHMAAMKDARVAFNVFKDCAGCVDLGGIGVNGMTTTESRCRDILFTANILDHVGSDNQVGLRVHTVDRLTIADNLFEDCGKSGVAGYALDFNLGATSSVILLRNRIVTLAGITTVAIRKDAAHTYAAASNQQVGNEWPATLSHAFYAFRTDIVVDQTNFTIATLPDSFPIGESMTLINGDATAPDALKQGVLLARKHRQQVGDTTGNRLFVVQWYYPTNNTDVYFRFANSATNTWQAFKKLTGV